MLDTIKVFIAGDHRLFREGLRLILERAEGVEIVGEATNGLQTIALICDLKPDLVLIDTSPLEKNGMQTIRLIREKSPKTKTIIIVATLDESKIFRGLKAGAKGYLQKDASAPDLLKAIHTVQRGELWVQRKLLAKYFDEEANNNLAEEDREGKEKDKLTPRESEVLHCLSKGYTNKKIAEHLYISEKTVKSHLSSIFKKLDTNGRLQAALHAIDLGLE
jgi:DNA-binding NarL/FixJ family response regulator